MAQQCRRGIPETGHEAAEPYGADQGAGGKDHHPEQTGRGRTGPGRGRNHGYHG